MLCEEMSVLFLNPDTGCKIYFLMAVKPALLAIASLANKISASQIPRRYLLQNQLLFLQHVWVNFCLSKLCWTRLLLCSHMPVVDN